jgi:glycosidase
VRITRALVAGGIVLGIVAATRRPAVSQAPHPDWARGAVIYELNVRQYSPEGTFRAVLPRLDALKKLGVDIVWLMPIHPIGEKNRKGTLGSYYAVRDYYGINPEFGTLDDFKALVDGCHARGMRVIIDLVANHTAWDNPMASEHPDWYKHDRQGRFVPPIADWEDVIALDYGNRDLREYMMRMMEYWVRDVGIDGYRCDVANFVPTSFWEEARPRLDRIKPVFMLAEAESPELVRKAFDCDYASEYFLLFDRIARKKGGAGEIDRLIAHDRRIYPAGSWRMMFITNHDQNTWKDSDVHMYGVKGARAFAALTFALPGRPLIYSGQEVANPRKLVFFEHDPIEWGGANAASMRAFYETMSGLYHAHPALQRGAMERIATAAPIYAFWRRAGGDEPVLFVVNLSDQPAKARLPSGRWRDLLGGAEVEGGSVALRPWQPLFLVQR